MSVRFNPPPGWPLVESGTLPPVEWQPDTSLARPPAQWPFYLDPRGHPIGPPPGAWTPALADVAEEAAEAQVRTRGGGRGNRWAAFVVTCFAIAVLVLAMLSLLR